MTATWARVRTWPGVFELVEHIENDKRLEMTIWEIPTCIEVEMPTVEKHGMRAVTRTNARSWESPTCINIPKCQTLKNTDMYKYARNATRWETSTCIYDVGNKKIKKFLHWFEDSLSLSLSIYILDISIRNIEYYTHI